MNPSTVILILFILFIDSSMSGELTFELPDNEKMCFYENVEQGEQATLEFQVITGGNYDVDMELTAPNGQVLYKDIKKQYDSFTWTAQHKGIHTFCFSNEFSTFTHKIVYFDLEVGDEKPAVEEMGDHQTAMTLMETSSVNIFESLKSVLDYQTHHRLREAQGRAFAEDLNERVLYWSIGESLVIILIGIGQILVLRSFFTNTHKTSAST
ncbi:transmembrane emp24 domain-containing protein 3 [Biomphalaria glabrata]|nr:transmembrane emp24 domain-containing protein 3 [Biomphalaria glabrata]